VVITGKMAEALVTSATPRDAAAVILLRQDTDPSNPELFWVKRSDKLAFLGGFHAFPGGQIDAGDAEVVVANSPNAQTAAMVSGAARELFEELGVLVARGGKALTKGQRASLLDDLESGRLSWPALLKHYELELDAADFTFAGRWVTPPFNARRFDTWFFIVNCPAKQEPRVLVGELAEGEWLTARDAYDRWLRSDVVAVPPTLHALKTLADGITPDLVERFLSIPQARGESARRITFRPNYICFPVRTPTRPPATHTCCYLIHTSKELLIVDPGSPFEDEQLALAQCVDELISEGRQVREIILTHLHPDHVGGVNALKDHLDVQVAAHAETAEALVDVQVDRFITDDEIIALQGEPQLRLRALHTPGHALGHLCLHDEEHGVLLTGDNILGLGSVLIDPPQGNMRAYLSSLQRMRSLPNLAVLFGGHGPAVATPYQKIDEYIAHRLEREKHILEAVRDGAVNAQEIVARVYTDVSPKAHSMAERSVIAHLEKLEEDGLVIEESPGCFVAAWTTLGEVNSDN
jgi:glyoxylase-like metal-dependent hydrolase (beta-lactamase superfamily II)/8-oxo-dGTP pyrophosphatase MutT (NUDIX family)